MILKAPSGKKIRVEGNKVVNRVLNQYEQVMSKALVDAINHGMITGQFNPPSLNGLDVATDAFYQDIVRSAFRVVNEKKNPAPKHRNKVTRKKLAGKKGPKGIPNNLDALADIFQDNKYFRQLMKRSKKVSEKMKRFYQAKMKKKFTEIMPRVLAGDIDARTVQKEMSVVWEKSRARVETIFQTENTNYFQEVSVKFFKDDSEIIGFLFECRETSTSTEICESRHGMVFTREMTGKHSIEYNTPALHFNCHSRLIPLANTLENRKLILDSSRDPTKHVLTPLPSGWR